MSWTSDVRDELKALDTSKKSLRNFGLTVGIIFILIAVWFFFRHKHPVLVYVLGALGALLALGGAAVPAGLLKVYRAWMGFAFAMGWVVSRVILSLMFFLIIFPIGLAARLMGKEFIDLDMRKKKDTYWIKKADTSKINYEKMG